MLTLTNSSQLPQADDINFDALEPLFAAAKSELNTKAPWIDFIDLGVSPENEIWQLGAKLEFLKEQVNVLQKELNLSHEQIGFYKSTLQKNEKDLESLADLRYKAAESIAYRIKSEQVEAKILELKTNLERLEKHPYFEIEKKVQNILSGIFQENDLEMTLLWVVLSIFSVLVFIFTK